MVENPTKADSVTQAKTGQRFAIGVALAVVAGLPISAIAQATPPVSRQQFAERLSKVKVGMPTDDVQRLVGKPDEQRPFADSGERKEHLWCYGIGAAGGLPTLGSVVVDRSGTVTAIFGSGPSAIADGSLDEDKIRRIFCTINGIGEIKASQYDPLAMIQSVNRLQPLGKAKSLELIKEYVRILPTKSPASRWHVVVLMRMLFESDEPSQPRVNLGASSPPDPPADLAKSLPAFPLVVVEDAPIVAISGFALFGSAPSETVFIDYYQKHGRLRERPLHPTEDLAGLLSRIEGATWWRIYKDDAERGRQIVAIQLLRLAKTVYPINERELRGLAGSSVGARWDSIRNGLTPQRIRWDTSLGEYRLRNDKR